MKKSNRQMVMGSLQPLLFCIGMYCVILIFSVFICSSLYNAFKSGKHLNNETKTEVTATADHQTVASLQK